MIEKYKMGPSQRKAKNEGKGLEKIYKFKILIFCLENPYPSQTLHTNP